MKDSVIYKAYCISWTFQHVKYIVDTLNGFCIQQTNFPYLCVIIDDASTDGEPELIRAYLDENFNQNLEDKTCVHENNDAVTLLGQHKTNKNCYFYVVLLKYNHYSIGKGKFPYFQEMIKDIPYAAPCEGDDYWISLNKLQQQIDFLEQHPECSAVFGNRLSTNEDKTSTSKTRFSKNLYNIKDVMAGLMPGVQNIAYRTKGVVNYKLPEINGDMCLYYKLAQIGELAHIHEDWAVYRRTGHGMATGRKPEDVWRISMESRYKFHKVLGFRYNRQLVKSQVYNVLAHIFKGDNLIEGLSYMRVYACPNKITYLWVPLYVIYYFLQSVNRRFFFKKGYSKE